MSVADAVLHDQQMAARPRPSQPRRSASPRFTVKCPLQDIADRREGWWGLEGKPNTFYTLSGNNQGLIFVDIRDAINGLPSGPPPRSGKCGRRSHVCSRNYTIQ